MEIEKRMEWMQNFIKLYNSYPSVVVIERVAELYKCISNPVE
jgi:hypothetical protein